MNQSQRTFVAIQKTVDKGGRPGTPLKLARPYSYDELMASAGKFLELDREWMISLGCTEESLDKHNGTSTVITAYVEIGQPWRLYLDTENSTYMALTALT